MGACLFVGSKDKLMCNLGGINPRLLSGRKPNVPETLRRIPGYKVGGIQDEPHAQDWIRACKESFENRVQPSSNFDFSGPFNEMVVMGVLAVRLQALNKILEWDGEKMEFTNIGANEEIRTVIKDGFKIHDGHPTFDKDWTEPMNALAYSQELIKHTYRDGWSLPDMPA